MKTAEEWWNESDTHWSVGRASITKSVIKQIQADALKEAAEIASRRAETSDVIQVIKTANEIRDAILARAGGLNDQPHPQEG